MDSLADIASLLNSTFRISTPLVFALPASGSEKSEVDYRVMLKKILGV